MELRYYGAMARRWWWLIALALILPAGLAFLAVQSRPHRYQSTTTIFVNQSASPNSVTYYDALLNVQLVKTFSEMAKQPVVLEDVRQRLHLPFSTTALTKMVVVQPVRDSQLFDITVQSNDPTQASAIANTIAQAFLDQQRPYAPPDQAGSAIRVVQPALVPDTPISSHAPVYAVLAALLGVMIAIGALGIHHYFDDTVRTPEQLEAATDLVTVGGVVRARYGRRVAISPLRGPMRTATNESYRLIRTNLEFAGVGARLKTLLVTSAHARDGRSTVVANLAMAFSQAGKRVVVIDADLRNPRLHTLFGLANHHGLTDALMTDDIEILDVLVQPCAVPGLSLLTAGVPTGNPADVLASPRLRAVLNHLRLRADVIIVDSPPMLAVADPVILANRMDATLLVVNTGRTRVPAIVEMRDVLARSRSRLLGVALNRLNPQSGMFTPPSVRERTSVPPGDTNGGSSNGALKEVSTLTKA